MPRHAAVLLFVLVLCLAIRIIAATSTEIEDIQVVSRVIDGDTFDTYVYRVRLADIDAPELSESGGLLAKQALSSLVSRKDVYLDIDDVYIMDRYGRIVAVVYIRWNSTHLLNVNKWMVDNGFAYIKDYSNEFNPYTWSLYVYYPETEETVKSELPTQNTTTLTETITVPITTVTTKTTTVAVPTIITTTLMKSTTKTITATVNAGEETVITSILLFAVVLAAIGLLGATQRMHNKSDKERNFTLLLRGVLWFMRLVYAGGFLFLIFHLGRLSAWGLYEEMYSWFHWAIRGLFSWILCEVLLRFLIAKAEKRSKDIQA